jgi:hypothetical protein
MLDVLRPCRVLRHVTCVQGFCGYNKVGVSESLEVLDKAVKPTGTERSGR